MSCELHAFFADMRIDVGIDPLPPLLGGKRQGYRPGQKNGHRYDSDLHRFPALREVEFTPAEAAAYLLKINAPSPMCDVDLALRGIGIGHRSLNIAYC
jgi:hypothetical protein